MVRFFLLKLFLIVEGARGGGGGVKVFFSLFHLTWGRGRGGKLVFF